MKVRNSIIILTLTTLVSWAAWVVVVRSVDPGGSSFIGPVIFYLTLFFALVGTFTLVGYFMRLWRSHNEVVYRHVATAFRQGILLSLAFIAALILQSFHYLSWWAAGISLVAVGIIELFFLSQRNNAS